MAGGEGSRLRPLTLQRPKPMVPLVNKSCIVHILDLLAQARGHRGRCHTPVPGAAHPRPAWRVVRRPGHALCAGGRSPGHRRQREECPVLHRRHLPGHLRRRPHRSGSHVAGQRSTRNKGSVATLALYHVPNPLEYGVVITDEDGHIRQFQEKPSWGEVFSDTINTGIYVLNPEIFDLVPKDRPFDFSQDLFPKSAAAGRSDLRVRRRRLLVRHRHHPGVPARNHGYPGRPGQGGPGRGSGSRASGAAISRRSRPARSSPVRSTWARAARSRMAR